MRRHFAFFLLPWNNTRGTVNSSREKFNRRKHTTMISVLKQSNVFNGENERKEEEEEEEGRENEKV